MNRNIYKTGQLRLGSENRKPLFTHFEFESFAIPIPSTIMSSKSTMDLHFTPFSKVRVLREIDGLKTVESPQKRKYISHTPEKKKSPSLDGGRSSADNHALMISSTSPSYSFQNSCEERAFVKRRAQYYRLGDIDFFFRHEINDVVVHESNSLSSVSFATFDGSEQDEAVYELSQQDSKSDVLLFATSHSSIDSDMEADTSAAADTSYGSDEISSSCLSVVDPARVTFCDSEVTTTSSISVAAVDYCPLIGQHEPL